MRGFNIRARTHNSPKDWHNSKKSRAIEYFPKQFLVHKWWSATETSFFYCIERLIIHHLVPKEYHIFLCYKEGNKRAKGVSQRDLICFSIPKWNLLVVCGQKGHDFRCHFATQGRSVMRRRTLGVDQMALGLFYHRRIVWVGKEPDLKENKHLSPCVVNSSHYKQYNFSLCGLHTHTSPSSHTHALLSFRETNKSSSTFFLLFNIWRDIKSVSISFKAHQTKPKVWAAKFSRCKQDLGSCMNALNLRLILLGYLMCGLHSCSAHKIRSSFHTRGWEASVLEISSLI